MGTANGKEKKKKKCLVGKLRGKHRYDPEVEEFRDNWGMFENVVLLNEVLQETNSSERTSVLEKKMYASFCYEKLKVTPLIFAAKNGNVDCVKVLLKYKADIEGRAGDENDRKCWHNVDCCDGCDFLWKRTYSCKGCTPLFAAASYGHLDVLSCLVENGADVNACSIYTTCTPLMIACAKGHVNAVTFLIEHGANIDLQNKNGDTALHYAVDGNSSKVLNKLLSFGASQVHNSQKLTPLLLASNQCNISVVKYLITRPEYTKEQRIDALELLGASLATPDSYLYGRDTKRGFQYIKRGMQERFADPSHPLLKQPMEPVKAYQNRRESQTFEELAQIEHYRNAIIIESLIIRERIIGTNNAELLEPIRTAAKYVFFRDGNFLCAELCRHAIKIAQNCNLPAICDLYTLTYFLYTKVWSYDPPRPKDILELLGQIILECEKQQKLRNESVQFRFDIHEQSQLFNSALQLVLAIAKFKLYEEGKSSCLSVLLKRLCCLNLQNEKRDTLLHKAVEEFTTDAFLCLDTVKLLLNEGINVNAINSNGDTPLHRAVTFQPSNDNIHLLTDMLEALLDGRAHHDFVNNDGKTAMDLAQTDEARWILSEKRKLELKCISARAVKKFGLPYLGVVPKILEKYVSMH